TVIDCEPKPHFVSNSELQFDVRLESRGEREIRLRMACHLDRSTRKPSLEKALTAVNHEASNRRGFDGSIHSSSDRFDQCLRRCQSDLKMMLTPTAQGAYPYAGIPWFCTPFG